MREIKSRGRSEKNSEWLVGSLVCFGNFKCIWAFDADFYDLVQRDRRLSPEYIIDPKTVGQYIGLIDEKGAQVYEGDIVECYGEDSEVILVAEVQFQEGSFCVQIDYDLHLIPLDAFGSAYKVIGNIHENPNLLTNE